MFLVFDGTLADTRVAFLDAFDEAAQTMNIQPFRRDDEAYLRTLEASKVLRGHGIATDQFPAFTSLLKQGMEKRHSQVGQVHGVADVLGRLVSTGRPVGLITSNSEALVRSVFREVTKLFHYMRFDVSLTTKSAVQTRAALEYSSLGRLHYVGDEIRDFPAALAADVSFSAVTWGFNTEASLREEGCDNFIRHPSELARIEQRTWRSTGASR